MITKKLTNLATLQVSVSVSNFEGGVAWFDGGALEFVESTGRVADSVVLRNSASSGGAIKLTGSNMTFYGMLFRKNYVRNTGGVFDAFLSNSTIELCNFDRNLASNVGGCLNGFDTIYITNQSVFQFNTAEANGGVASLFNAKLYDYDSKFMNNSAYQGGVFSLEDDAHIYLTRSYVAGNNVTGNGAAVRLYFANMTTDGATFYNNTALPGGAAVIGIDGNIWTYNTTFTNHTSKLHGSVMELRRTTSVITNTTFKLNHAVDLGGAIWTEDSNLTFVDTLFFKNFAKKGGGLFLHATDLTEEGAYVEFQGGHFFKNLASDAGAAFEVSQAANIRIKGTLFEKNECPLYGGAIHMEYGNATFDGARFVKNKALYGAGIETIESEFWLVDTVFEENEASWGGGLELKESIAHAKNSRFLKNKVSYDGGAWNIQQNSAVDFEGCELYQNEAQNNAGGIWVKESEFNATTTLFKENRARKADGGGVFTLESNSTYRTCTFDGNAARKGPTIYNHGGRMDTFCQNVPLVYNARKVGGKVKQDCIPCEAGSWGDIHGAGSKTCFEECGVPVESAVDCYVCPYAQGCTGERSCLPPLSGEQCLTCPKDSAKLFQMCVPIYGIYVLGIWAFLCVIFFIGHLAFGPELDVHQYTRVKLMLGFLQHSILVGKVSSAFGLPADFFIGLAQPLALWMDLSSLRSIINHVAGGEAITFVLIEVANILLPVLILVGLILIQNSLYNSRKEWTTKNVDTALHYLKKERKIGQFTLLYLEMLYMPLLYNAGKMFHCMNTTKGLFLVADHTFQCSGVSYTALRGLAIAAFILVGGLVPLGLR